MLNGTEADIINSIARLRRATKAQVRRQVGFSSEYIGFLCWDLVRRGFLDFSEARYSLAKEGIITLLAEQPARVDRKLLKEVAVEVAREISGELKKSIKAPVSVRAISRESEEKVSGQIKIKTDFDMPVNDESLTLESNINKIGARLEKEKSDIDKSVELFKRINQQGREKK